MLVSAQADRWFTNAVVVDVDVIVDVVTTSNVTWKLPVPTFDRSVTHAGVVASGLASWDEPASGCASPPDVDPLPPDEPDTDPLLPLDPADEPEPLPDDAPEPLPLEPSDSPPELAALPSVPSPPSSPGRSPIPKSEPQPVTQHPARTVIQAAQCGRIRIPRGETAHRR
jgi:hypothetical protein